MVVYTWWCWHIYKGEVVGVEVDQLGEEEALLSITELWSRSDRTLRRCVRSLSAERLGLGLMTGLWRRHAIGCAVPASGPTDMAAFWHAGVGQRGPDPRTCPVTHERICLVTKFLL